MQKLVIRLFKTIRADIKLDIDSVRSELAASITSLQASLTSHYTRVKDLEKAVDFTGDCDNELHATVGQLQGEVRDPQAKCEDLEGRSRRKNLRLTGVEEGGRERTANTFCLSSPERAPELR